MTIESTKVEQISHIMDILEELRNMRPLETFNDNHNLIWGELDWLDELHRVLHEE